jgi:DNA-binding transcriptional ArsR family regulator
MAESGLSHATAVFKAAGHPVRIRILGMLRPGGLCVCQITAVLELAVSTVSAHLAELKRAGLVVEHKDGRWVSHSLSEDPDVTPMLARVWALVADDPQVVRDARLVRSLRRIPVEDLCRAVPTDALAGYMGRDAAWWSVPLVVLAALPLYSNAAGMAPVLQALVEKGAALGTALAFMMAVVGVSLPETILLRRVLKPRLIAVFVGVVTVAIIVTGYLFNLVL